MKQLSKILSAVVLLMTVCSIAFQPAQAQGLKIAYVDDQMLIKDYKAWQRAQEQWDLESKAWEDEAQEMQTAIQDLISEYDKQKLILSDEKKKEKEAAIRVKQEALDNYTRQVFGPGGTAERKQAELIVPLQENITKAIEAIALEGNYDIVFTVSSSGLGYIKQDFDITPRVLEYLEGQEQ